MMLKLLDTEREVKDIKDASDLEVSDAVVRFDDVSFRYNDARDILNGVSFVIPHGQKVAVVGPSGAGKSTLARLLFRFYDLSSGSISIDGQNISHVSQNSLRDNIGIVPQDTVLFNHTIEHNIRYAGLDASREEIEQAAKHANIHDFISSLPDGYDTVVGERGLKLSGGEKQRIAIARVILKNPRILVFDEATSSLDSHSEQLILESLRAGLTSTIAESRWIVCASMDLAARGGILIMREVVIQKEPVELYKILKFEGMVPSGGVAKLAIESGDVLVNDEVETRKRKKIVAGRSKLFGELVLFHCFVCE